jgi:hypothetical protein
MKTDEALLDRLETMILLALDGNKNTPFVGATKMRMSGGYFEQFDQGDLLNFNNKMPNSFYTFDMTDESRLYTTDSSLLLSNPIEILGNESEIALINEHGLRWTAYKKINKRPKGVVCLGKPVAWYEAHTKFIQPTGNSLYIKRVLPLDAKGNPLAAMVNNHVVCTPNIEGKYLTIAASLIEDAHRPNTMLAEVKDGVSIKFPVPINNYKALFAGREEPLTPSGRRKAIVHWVAQHLRQGKNDTATVKQHIRGVQDICVGGVNITITPNDKVFE